MLHTYSHTQRHSESTTTDVVFDIFYRAIRDFLHAWNAQAYDVRYLLQGFIAYMKLRMIGAKYYFSLLMLLCMEQDRYRIIFLALLARETTCKADSHETP